MEKIKLAGAPRANSIAAHQIAGQSTRERIIQAAVDCIADQGASKTVMDDIAQRAQISRQGVYKAIGNRETIFQAVVLRRMGAVTRQVRAAVDGEEDIIEAFLIGSIKSVGLAREDQVFSSLLEASSSDWLRTMILAPGSPIRAPVIDGFLWAWRGLIARARHAQMLRHDLSDHDIAIWLLSAHYLIDALTFLTPDEQREMVRVYVLPSIMSPGYLRKHQARIQKAS